MIFNLHGLGHRARVNSTKSWPLLQLHQPHQFTCERRGSCLPRHMGIECLFHKHKTITQLHSNIRLGSIGQWLRVPNNGFISQTRVSSQFVIMRQAYLVRSRVYKKAEMLFELRVLERDPLSTENHWIKLGLLANK